MQQQQRGLAGLPGNARQLKMGAMASRPPLLIGALTHEWDESMAFFRGVPALWPCTRWSSQAGQRLSCFGTRTWMRPLPA